MLDRCSLAQVNLKELQYLQHKLGPRGFSVLAFPSSQFDGEAGAGDETVRVVREKYHATFPVFGKVRCCPPGPCGPTQLR